MTHINLLGRQNNFSGSHVRQVIICGAGAFMRSLLEMVSRVAPKYKGRVLLLNTPQEAESLLKADAHLRAENTLNPTPSG